MNTGYGQAVLRLVILTPTVMMATKSKASKQELTPAVLAAVGSSPAIPMQVQSMMDYLERLHPPSLLQMHMQELLQKMPPGMPRPERQLRLTALRQLGYKDLSKRGPYPENAQTSDED